MNAEFSEIYRGNSQRKIIGSIVSKYMYEQHYKRKASSLTVALAHSTNLATFMYRVLQNLYSFPEINFQDFSGTQIIDFSRTLKFTLTLSLPKLQR